MTVYEFMTAFAAGVGMKPKRFEKECGLGNRSLKSLSLRSHDKTFEKIKERFPHFDKTELFKCCGEDFAIASEEEESDEVKELNARIAELQSTIKHQQEIIEFLISKGKNSSDGGTTLA